jgi:hypothetical protein
MNNLNWRRRSLELKENVRKARSNTKTCAKIFKDQLTRTKISLISLRILKIMSELVRVSLISQPSREKILEKSILNWPTKTSFWTERSINACFLSWNTRESIRIFRNKSKIISNVMKKLETCWTEKITWRHSLTKSALSSKRLKNRLLISVD